MFKFDFVTEYIVSISMVIESFAGYRSLDGHLWSLRDCNASAQAPMAFRVSIEKPICHF